jgi:hypothetical protein
VTLWDAGVLNMALVVKAFHWAPSELAALTLEELAEYADLARRDLGL